MSITDQGADLARFALFEGFTDSDLDALATAMEHATFDEDRFIFREGEQRGLLAIIQEGSVAIEKGAESRMVRLATLSAGEALGEGAV
ncbi:MAG TPA: cyclic nucleotide-binding domain-containing protein, partial [Gemmatimonadaceae bacterium]